MTTIRRLCVCVAACALLGAAGAAQQEALDPDRARALLRRERAGDTLSPDEQAYLDRARAERQRDRTRGTPRRDPGAAPGGSTGLVPLADLGDATYEGLEGGLYGGGRNDPPPALADRARRAAAAVEPLDADGRPARGGAIGLLSIGMSNTTQEFSRFRSLAAGDPRRHPALVIVDGAQGGRDASDWAASGGRNAVWAQADRRLEAAGVTRDQVQAIWIKQALRQPSRIGPFADHREALARDLRLIIRIAESRFPNLRLVFLSSRTYAGYARTALNPEPYAYEGAFAVRDVVLDHLRSNTPEDDPVLLWGPYLWADGVRGRAGDGLVWQRTDFADDGTHPSEAGREKVARLLLEFFATSDYARRWFVRPATPN